MSITRDEAIAELQACVDAWDRWVPTNGSMADRNTQAVKMALSALRHVSREQVEKVWRGEWLNFYNEFSTAECSKCGELFEVSPDEMPKEEFFKAFKGFYHFCPSCGAPMTDEAVQMVLERMEDMYHG